MRQIHAQEVAAVSGGCYQDSNGNWVDIFYDSTTGISWPVPCQRPHIEAGTPVLGGGGSGGRDGSRELLQYQLA